MGHILRWGSLQLCQSLVNGLYNDGIRIGDVGKTNILMYQSIPSLTIPRPKPQGNFFDGRIPSLPRQKESSKPRPPRPIKTS